MEITADSYQVVASGNNIIFTDTLVKGNCAIMHRDGSGLITLRGLTNQPRARFKIFFSSNITQTAGTPGQVVAGLALNGESITCSVMSAVPAALADFWNISTSLYVEVPAGCCASLSVKNLTTNSDAEVGFANSNLIVERVA